MVVLAALRRKAMKSKQSHTSHNCALTLEFVYQQQPLTKHVQVYKRVLQANICRAKKTKKKTYAFPMRIPMQKRGKATSEKNKQTF